MLKITYAGKDWEVIGQRDVPTKLVSYNGVLHVFYLKRRGERRSVEIRAFQQSVQRTLRQNFPLKNKRSVASRR